MATNPIQKDDIAVKNVDDNLTSGLKRSREEVDKLNKSLIELGKTQKKNIEQIKKQPDTIKKTKELNKEVKKAETTAKSINKTRAASDKIQKQLLATEVKLIAAKSKEAKEVAKLNLEAKKQNDLNKEAAVLNQKNLGTLERISVRNKQLIRERKTLNLDTKKGRDRLRDINKELDKNNKRVKENVSQLEKQKIGIGDYASGLKEAAGASGLFGGVLGKLAAIQGTINALMKTGVATEKADIVAKEGQAAATTQLTLAQRAANAATGAGVKALKLLKVALAATGIGALVLLLGGLFAAFTRNQDRIDQLSDGMARLGALVDVLVDRLSLVGEGLVKVFTGLGDELKKVQIRLKIFLLEALQFDAFGKTINDNTEEVAKLNAELATLGGVGEGIELLKKAAEGLAEELKKDNKEAGKLNALTREATREAKLFEAQQAATLTTVKELNLISRDKLKSDEERIAALKEANKLEVALAKDQLDIQEQLLASSLDALNANKDQLELQPEHLKFINAIKDGSIEVADAIQQAADFTLSSAAGEQALNDIIDRIVEQEQARQSLLDKQATTIKKLSALEVQVATKQAMALTREATAKRQLAKNDELSIERRTELLKEAAIAEVNAFREQTKVHVKNEEELAAARIQIKAKFLADVKKLEDDEEKRRLAAEGKLTAIEARRAKATEELRIAESEGQIAELERRLENEENLTVEAQIKIINEIFELRKKAIIAADKFAQDRAEEAAAARRQAILDNEKLTEEEKAALIKAEEEATAEERKAIAVRTQDDLEDIEQGRVSAVKDANDKILENEKESNREREKIAKDAAKQFADIIKARNKENAKLIDEEIKRAQDSIDRQREIAAKGQENILGEEQARLDKANLEKKREAERAAKEEQNIALAIAFLNNLASRNKTDPKTAFALAARDTIGAKLFAEGLASFFEGTDDTGTTDKPLDSKGGRRVIVHDNEQIWSKQNVKDGGGRTRQEAIDVLQAYDKGLDLSPSHFKQLEVSSMIQPKATYMRPMNSQLKEQTDRLEAAFKKGQTNITTHWNELGDATEIRYKNGVRKATTFKRPRLG